MRVAVVGLGIMGAAMSKRLLEFGHTVTVANRTRAKAEPIISLGARYAETPAKAAGDADVVLTIVTNPAAVREVTLGQDGILAALPSSAVHADMSTVTPQSATEIAQAYTSAGKQFVQSPVLGSRTQIEQSNLLIMAGGEPAAIDKCRKVWSAFAKKVWTLDNAAQASAMKLACNMLIGQMILGLGQSLVFARRYGIAASELLDALDASALSAPMYRTKGKAILAGDYSANFVVNNLLKDIVQASDAALAADGLVMPLNELAREFFSQAVAAGYGEEDYSAVVKVLAHEAGVSLEEPTQ